MLIDAFMMIGNMRAFRKGKMLFTLNIIQKIEGYVSFKINSYLSIIIDSFDSRALALVREGRTSWRLLISQADNNLPRFSGPCKGQ